ncbi:MAG: trimethylamine methyltransferase family protein [Chloroflexota bacterium]|nr:MAG: trimethylamine methyltransferase family protein [Chloroflexota bacterium]
MGISITPVLTRLEVDRIHEHSLDLLERVGIDYKTPRALQILENFGCPVDYERTWASLPREVVEWALQQTTRVVKLTARDPDRSVILDGRRPHHTTDSQGTQVIDLESGEIHDSTTEDLSSGLRFADALDLIEIVNVMVSASDLPGNVRILNHYALAFSQTSKHIRSGVHRAEEVPFLVELVKAATGEDYFTPIFSAVDCTVSPLMHDGPMTEACIELAKVEVPIMVYPMPLAGGTSPVTVGGTIVVHNVEFLSGLVLFQLVNPGTPIIYGTGASQLDMQTGRYGGSADGYTMCLGLAEMARFYNLPFNVGGLSTRSHDLDAQYGAEAMTHGLLAYLAGADEIYSMGLLGDAQILSFEKMVADNLLAHQLEAMVKPLNVDEAHLQAELIAKVGIGGHYLKQRETRDFTKQEYVPMWPPADKTILELAREEALEIYHHHEPPPLPSGARSQMETILKEADAAFAL